MNQCEQYCRTIQRMANAVGGGLPPEYQQVEYLESSKTQGIDTGVLVPDNYLRVVSRLKCTIFPNNNHDVRFFGSQKNPNCSIVPWHYFDEVAGPFSTLAAGSSFYINTNIITYINTIYEIDLTANNGNLSGNYCGGNINTTYSGTVATGYTEGLFFNHNSNNYSGATNNKGACAIYYHKIYTSAGLVRDFIPCYRKSDNKPGMYDLITNTFYTNIGTGEFTLGPSIDVPSEYQQVEYLQSTGEQVIDLGSIWAAVTQSEFEFSLTDNYTFANSSFILGGYMQGAAYSLAFPASTTMRVPINGNGTNYTIPNIGTGKHAVIYKPNGIIYDGVTYTATGTGDFTFCLFGRGDGYKTAGVRIYRYKRYNTDSSTYTHDLIPCYRKADNVTGMYNLINHTFIPYTGTANFIKGRNL